MKNFAEFVAAHKEKIYEQAEKNTKRNAQGRTVINRSDSWFYEDEWDEYYKELTTHDNSTQRSSAQRSVVR